MAERNKVEKSRQGKTLVSPWEEERICWTQGARMVCGVDEAGAGPLAGAVYAGAVILPPELEIDGLNDSKKLTANQRAVLYDTICEKAIAWAVAWADETEIDKTDILSARMLAMQRAIDKLSPAADFALVDGNRDHGKHAAITTPHRTLVGGDGRSASIAAASILAKVSRDRYMEEMAERYPQYEFERHKGCPTKRHYECLREYGPCPIHRKTFFEKAVSGGESKRRGSWGERLVAADLERKGFRILTRGYHSRFGEIDLIAANEQYLCFTEVKLRKSRNFAPAWAFVDTRKQEKLRITAEIFLSEHPELEQQPRFDIAEVYAPQGVKTAEPQIIYWENAF